MGSVSKDTVTMETTLIDEEKEEAMDEWMVESITRYHVIRMFEVPEPVLSCDWVRPRDTSSADGRIQEVVMVTDTGGLGSDLMCMKLPDCLTEQTQQTVVWEDCEKPLEQIFSSFAQDSTNMEDLIDIWSNRSWKLMSAALVRLQKSAQPPSVTDVVYISLCVLKSVNIDCQQWQTQQSHNLKLVAMHIRLLKFILHLIRLSLRNDDKLSDALRDVTQRLLKYLSSRRHATLNLGSSDKETVVSGRNCEIVWGQVTDKVREVTTLSADGDPFRALTTYSTGNEVGLWEEYRDEDGTRLGAKLTAKLTLEPDTSAPAIVAVNRFIRDDVTVHNNDVKFEPLTDVIIARRLDDIREYVSSGQMRKSSRGFQGSDVISSVEFVGSRLAVMVTLNGSVYSLDTGEEKFLPRLLLESQDDIGCVGSVVYGHSYTGDIRVYILHTGYTLRIVELETSGDNSVGATVVAAARLLDVGATVSPQSRDLAVDPHCCDRISLAGPDGNIYIYDTCLWRGDMTSSVPEPLFVHDGHVVCTDQSRAFLVNAHLWYPWRPDTLLSCAKDGSLHILQPKLSDFQSNDGKTNSAAVPEMISLIECVLNKILIM